MKRQNSLLLTGIAMSVLTACNSAAKRDVSQDTTAQLNRSTPASPGPPSDFTKGLLLIREASLRASVTDIGGSAKKIRRWLENEGGYYTEWEQGRQDDSLGISLTAKVPAARFESFKDSLETLGDIGIESIQATDVTDTYLGNQGGMTTTQKIGDQYRAILQNGAKPKDALAVEEKVAEKLTSAEELRESMASLNKQAAAGTLHIRLSMFSPLPLPQAPAYGHRLLVNLEDGWEELGVILLFFAGIWPWMILVAGGVIFWRRYRRI